MADSGEKTEKATPKRKRDERKKGNIFKSTDIVSAFSILIIFFALHSLFPFYLRTFYSVTENFISLAGENITLNDARVKSILLEIMKTVTVTAGPIFMISIAVSVIFTGAQTRFIFSMQSLKPKFSRMNPIQGIKNLFSMRSIVEVIKSLLKIAIIIGIITDTVKKNIKGFSKLFDVEPISALEVLLNLVFSLAMTIGVVFVFLGVFDILYQWYDHEKRMRMTKQEVKEEYKQLEGDPKIKGQIKQKQREMAQRRMMQEVPKADVIIRNPTHIAVAIKYEAEKRGAPVVIAKGMDYIAEKIIKIAEENNILTTENIPLAHALYDEVDLGREIPPVFYKEVAEILAWVYSINKKQV